MNTTIASNDQNRRACRRVNVQRPCKIKNCTTGRYVAATTIDLSQHGIMVRLLQPSNLKPGDDVLIGVAMHEHQGMIQAKEMIESRVVRRLDSEDGQSILAVQFIAAIEQQNQQQSVREAA